MPLIFLTFNIYKLNFQVIEPEGAYSWNLNLDLLILEYKLILVVS